MTNTSESADERLPGDETPPLPASGVLLGIDPGRKRIGLAVSNFEQTMALPLETRQRQGTENDTAYFRKIVEEYRVAGLVIGLPVHMSGDEGTQARQAREWGDPLAAAVARPVAYWDERFTSHAADVLLFQSNLSPRKHKERRDTLAAKVLLQKFLDAPDRRALPRDIRR